jgi:hypothetical protein
MGYPVDRGWAAGAVLSFTTSSAALTVRGTRKANGRADARIVFDSVNQSIVGSTGLQISGLSSTSVNVSYASLISFGLAVWRDRCSDPSLVLLESCIFERNGAAVGVYKFRTILGPTSFYVDVNSHATQGLSSARI